MSGSGAGTATPVALRSVFNFVRGFVRDRLDPYARGIHFGFRCARRAEKRF